jgi:protein-tyrosine phosphatase
MVWRDGGSLNMDGGIHEVPVPGLSGTMWLCGKHFIAPDPEGVLRETGSSHVICLVKDYELRERYDTYLDWLRTSDRATWCPISDLGFDRFDVAIELFNRLFDRLRSGESVIVHCAAGIGRSGTLATAMCVMSGMTLDDASAHVSRHRPGAGPEAGPQREVLEELVGYLER